MPTKAGTRGVQSFDPDKLKAIRENWVGGPLRGRALNEVLNSIPHKSTGERFSNSTVTDYEAGRNKPEPWALVHLAKVLGVTPRDLCSIPEGYETLTNLREWAGLSRQDATRAFGWRAENYTRWESGLQAPPSSNQYRACQTGARVFGCKREEVQAAWQRSSQLP